MIMKYIIHGIKWAIGAWFLLKIIKVLFSDIETQFSAEQLTREAIIWGSAALLFAAYLYYKDQRKLNR